MNLLEAMKQLERRKIQLLLMMPLCVAAAVREARAAQIVVIDTTPSPSYARRQVETAASFYGLSLEVRVAKEGDGKVIVQEALRMGKPLALVITADALPMLDARRSLALLNGKIPVLIVGINEHTNGELLSQWSGGAFIGCKRAKPENTERWYTVADHGDVVQQLSGSRLPLTANDVPYLMAGKGSAAQWLIQARWGSEELPVFTRSAAGGGNVFFATDTQAVEAPISPDPDRQQAVFAAMAPEMLFLKYAAGEYAWHSSGAYANFTIDDLWLSEPYGHVNYEDLLRQSQVHNFHSTIAFIPWNFDRSEAGVAALFRENPDRLSICIHGNNHVHQEFGPLNSHPLEKQAADMLQGLARMEKFRELTGVPYDAVMVFPHSISPEATFDELRRHNYLATVNSLNVPSDAAAPAGAEFALRTATLQFKGFPSLRRYSAETEIPRAQLAIDAFLGNPMLFYAHESFFATGMDAFNKTADTVNGLQPSTDWQSLGDITRHLYLERLREDGGYDIRTYSGNIIITNRHGHDAMFYVEKYENVSQPFTVSVDGQAYSFAKSGSTLQLKLPIAKGAHREIAIRLVNNFNLASVDIGKHSFRTNMIRLLSDFRDNTVSRSEAGRWFIRSYANNGRPWDLAMIAVGGGVVVMILLSLARKRVRTSQTGAGVIPLIKAG
jgi:hypothetical protein